ncbi:MAG: DUF2029 domain-containing protein [Armatimonadetes bacterium]|nr:DUF2029 domain-containing protein [Armatimonadota bacterium]
MTRTRAGRVFLTALVTAALAGGLSNVWHRAKADPRDPGAHGSDFTVYTEAGSLMYRGVDPYTVAGSRPRFRYTYPPCFALLVGPLWASDRRWQAVIWAFCEFWLAIGLILEGRHLVAWLRERGLELGDRATGRYLLAASLGVVLPVAYCLQLGQVAIPLACLLVSGFRLALTGERRARIFAGGVLLGCAAGFKVFPVVPAGLAALYLWAGGDRRRGWLAAAGVAAGLVLWLFVLPALLLGWGANLAFLQSFKLNVLDSPALNQPEGLYNQDNLSLAIALADAGRWAGHEQEAVLRLDAPSQVALRLVVLALTVFAGCRLSRTGEPLAQAAAFGLACVGAVLMLPLVWFHYYVLTAPAVLYVPLQIHRAGRPRASMVMAWAPFVLCLVDYLGMPATHWWRVLPVGLAAWLVAALALTRGSE